MTQFKKDTFVHMDEVKNALKIAIETETNILLWGPGGYGKSDYIKYYLKQEGKTYKTITGHKDIRVEALIGTMDVEKFKNESSYDIVFENSPFVGAEILVLEEFMDVMPGTAMAIKDIITEGGFRYKGKFTKSSVKVIIMTSNIHPSELDNDESFKALYYSRFPIEVKVDWATKPAKKYNDLFKIKTNLDEEQRKLLAFTCERVKPSPRIALEAAKIYKKTDNIHNIVLIRDFMNLDIEALVGNVKDNMEFIKFDKVLKNALNIIESSNNDIGTLLHIKIVLNSLDFPATLSEDKRISLITIKNIVENKIKNIHEEFMQKTNIDTKKEMDEVFNDFK